MVIGQTYFADYSTTMWLRSSRNHDDDSAGITGSFEH